MLDASFLRLKRKMIKLSYRPIDPAKHHVGKISREKKELIDNLIEMCNTLNETNCIQLELKEIYKVGWNNLTSFRQILFNKYLDSSKFESKQNNRKDLIWFFKKIK